MDLRVGRQAHLLEQGPWIERKLHECITNPYSSENGVDTHQVVYSVDSSKKRLGGCLCVLVSLAPVLAMLTSTATVMSNHHHHHHDCGHESHDHDHQSGDVGPSHNIFPYIDRPHVVA